jgi:hypothetical protein
MTCVDSRRVKSGKGKNVLHALIYLRQSETGIVERANARRPLASQRGMSASSRLPSILAGASRPQEGIR